MVGPLKKQNLWIRNPGADSVYFTFGWIPVLYLLLTFPLQTGMIISVVLMFNYVHRHYTFPLVYGEREEFNKRKNFYIALPFMAALITGGFVVSGFFNILKMISLLWTMFHSVAQKVGIARVYSRKAGYGEAWIEKGLIYSWFLYLFFGIAQSEKETLLNFSSGRTILSFIEPHLGVFALISYGLFLCAATFTITYAYQEFQNLDRISLPKNIYIGATLALYLIFEYSLIYGYIVFAFSHAFEYIAFVNIFVASKYKRRPEYRSFLSRASGNLGLYSTGFAGAVLIICVIAQRVDPSAFSIYIVGSSFLHFIYDGWIWKVRKSQVGEPLGIKYQSVGSASGTGTPG